MNKSAVDALTAIREYAFVFAQQAQGTASNVDSDRAWQNVLAALAQTAPQALTEMTNEQKAKDMLDSMLGTDQLHMNCPHCGNMIHARLGRNRT